MFLIKYSWRKQIQNNCTVKDRHEGWQTIVEVFIHLTFDEITKSFILLPLGVPWSRLSPEVSLKPSSVTGWTVATLTSSFLEEPSTCTRVRWRCTAPGWTKKSTTVTFYSWWCFRYLAYLHWCKWTLKVADIKTSAEMLTVTLLC